MSEELDYKFIREELLVGYRAAFELRDKYVELGADESIIGNHPIIFLGGIGALVHIRVMENLRLSDKDAANDDEPTKILMEVLEKVGPYMEAFANEIGETYTRILQRGPKNEGVLVEEVDVTVDFFRTMYSRLNSKL